MMKSTVLVTLVLSLASPISHARFTQADTWVGINQQPITLNKYTYANNDSGNMIDPSGHNAISLSSFSVSSTIRNRLMLGVVGTSSVALFTSSNQGVPSNTDRQWGLWDVLATNYYRANETKAIRQDNAQAKATAIAISSAGETPHGHHTVPVMLCGRLLQRFAYLEAADHRALHTQLAPMVIAKTAAESRANKLLPTVGRHRNSNVLDMADTKAGRTAIGNTLDRFYKRSGWWNKGAPTIGTVFPSEKKLYIAKKNNTSLPNCQQ